MGAHRPCRRSTPPVQVSGDGSDGEDGLKRATTWMWTGTRTTRTCRSFYVGDAAGRENDHSAADIGFSKAWQSIHPLSYNTLAFLRLIKTFNNLKCSLKLYLSFIEISNTNDLVYKHIFT